MQASACLVAVLAAGCSSSSGGPSPGGPPDSVTFPQTFLWGSATAAFQVEKGDTHTDWAHWVATPGKIKNGDNPDLGGPDALDHIDDDIAALKSSGQNAYRLSLEWGRLYPTRAAFDADMPDPAAVQVYDSLLTKLRSAGITPVVTLHHFAFPDWLDDATQPSQPQGWERSDTQGLFAEYASRIAKRWGDKVDWWVTVNEPLVLALLAYGQGNFPPGVVLAIDRVFAVVKAEVRAHAAAFDAIHAADVTDADGDGKAAWVSVAKHQRTFHPLDPTDPDDAAATAHVEYVWNQWFLNAIVHGDFDDTVDGTFGGPNSRRGDPTLVGRADYLGINYYSDTLVSAHTGLVIPGINAAIRQDHLGTGRPETDVAWDIYPEGLGTVLDEAKGYGLPILVTENGLADAADANRTRFLLEHLYQLGWAVQRGADIRGYMHWSLVDNFEWSNGFCPKFGLFSYGAATGARSARPSVDAYRRVIGAGKLAKAEVDAAPPYASPTPCP